MNRWERLIGRGSEGPRIVTSAEASVEADSLSGDIIEGVKDVVQSEENPNIRATGIFGSVARGSATIGSDLNYLAIKQHGETGLVYTEEDMAFASRLSRLPMPASLMNVISLDELATTSFNGSLFAVFTCFTTPVEANRLGVQTFGYRSRRHSFVRDLVVVGRSSSEEKTIVQAIQTGRRNAAQVFGR